MECDLPNVHRSSGGVTENSPEDISISVEEENAIRYMAGYVVRKLNKKFHSMNFLVEKDRENITESYSAEWITLID